MGRRLEVTHLSVVEYDDGLVLQEELRGRVAAGEVPDQLLLLEHPPIITLGRNRGTEHVVAGAAELERRGVTVHETGRGGDVTFHGPGQIVGYPIVDLNPDRRDVRRYVRDLEEVLIRVLADWDVAAGRIPGMTGVWVGDFKVAAIGVRISRWVTSHGFALNVGTDLSYFDTIVPCGIQHHGVTSLSQLVGKDVPLEDVKPRLAVRFGEVFGREVVTRGIASRSVQCWVWRSRASGFEVLALERAPAAGGFWQPVTGLIESGEEPAGAARREVREETGLAGEPQDLELVRDFRIERRYIGGEGPHPWINREYAFALEVHGDPRVTLSEEHGQYTWLTPAEAGKRLKWGGNKRALERLERQLDT